MGSVEIELAGKRIEERIASIPCQLSQQVSSPFPSTARCQLPFSIHHRSSGQPFSPSAASFHRTSCSLTLSISQGSNPRGPTNSSSNRSLRGFPETVRVPLEATLTRLLALFLDPKSDHPFAARGGGYLIWEASGKGESEVEKRQPSLAQGARL